MGGQERRTGHTQCTVQNLQRGAAARSTVYAVRPSRCQKRPVLNCCGADQAPGRPAASHTRTRLA